MTMDAEDRALEAEREVGRINAFFPILPRLGNRWAASRPWEGLTVALNLHLTSLTAALVRELELGGGTFVVSGASPATTHAGTVEMLRNEGIEVYTGRGRNDRFAAVLDHEPDLIVDVGFELVNALLDRRPEQARHTRGAIEITRSGITRLRERGDILPFPVLNINDGRLKNAVENRHGVGEALWQAVAQLTGMHLAGRRVAVLGYGPVGKGLAMYARAAGMAVEIVEPDPVRRLFAHYDGFVTPSLDTALERAGVVVTATGRGGALGLEHIHRAPNGVILVNAGHGGDEIDVEGIRSRAVRAEHIGERVVRYALESGPQVTVLGDGHPLNIVTNAGSPEPVLLHFAVLGLALERLVTQDLPAGETIVDNTIEAEAAAYALDALSPSGSA
jgi:adenosylhomocysteinase